jgi:hypothetical protein
LLLFFLRKAFEGIQEISVMTPTRDKWFMNHDGKRSATRNLGSWKVQRALFFVFYVTSDELCSSVRNWF